jgi:hypothetical protein
MGFNHPISFSLFFIEVRQSHRGTQVIDSEEECAVTVLSVPVFRSTLDINSERYVTRVDIEISPAMVPPIASPTPDSMPGATTFY